MYRSILNSKKIKYDVLKKIIQPYLIGVNEVNCFISLNSILKSFYGLKPDVVAESLQTANSNALSSEIINIIAHYRHFFWSRFGIPSNYYIYYSLDMCEYCTEINTEYKKDYYDKRNGLSNIKEYQIINENIESNLNLIHILTEYLPNIFFINTKGFEPSALPQLLIEKNKQDSKIHNFIFTNDIIDYQLVKNPFTSVITLNSDNSKLINDMNLLGTYLKKETDLSSNFYVPLISITGYKKYNISGIKGMANVKTTKLLSKLLKEGSISDIEYSSMDEISKYINCDGKLLNNNFNILSLKNISKNITKKEFMLIRKQLINKSDNISLMEINNKYYIKNPLMLIELMEGEE